MANKKFYHRNQSKAASKNRIEARSEALVGLSEQQLALTLADLGLSENTTKLLSGSGINTAAELVIRTEKDMYKVQGLNKRILLEIKNALKAKGMELFSLPETEDGEQGAKSEPQKPAKQPAEDKKKQEKTPEKKLEQGKVKPQEEHASKFGLADRRDKQPQKQPAKAARPERPEKITEPLPVELWRKVIKGGKWGFSDGFKIVIPPMYDEVFSFKEGLASVEIDGKCGYIDSENNVVIPLEYDLAMSFSEGLAMVARGEKCGYINKQNEVVIGFEYDAASPFEGGEAKVKKDGKWATITPDGTLSKI